jgi:hypothetical protein
MADAAFSFSNGYVFCWTIMMSCSFWYDSSAAWVLVSSHAMHIHIAPWGAET